MRIPLTAEGVSKIKPSLDGLEADSLGFQAVSRDRRGSDQRWDASNAMATRRVARAAETYLSGTLPAEQVFCAMASGWVSSRLVSS